MCWSISCSSPWADSSANIFWCHCWGEKEQRHTSLGYTTTNKSILWWRTRSGYIVWTTIFHWVTPRRKNLLRISFFLFLKIWMARLVVDLVSSWNKMNDFVADFVFLQGLKKLTGMIYEDEWTEVFPSTMSSYLNSYKKVLWTRYI